MKTQRTDANVDRVQMNGKSTELFGSADKVTGIFSEKDPQLWPNKWILHYDNGLMHDMLKVHEFLAKKSIKKIVHPPYSLIHLT
jgi:hypothetical protein